MKRKWLARHQRVSLQHVMDVKVTVLVPQSCLTLYDPVDCSPPGSSAHGILQARTLEWVPFPSPGDHPNPGIEPRYPVLQADILPSEPPGKPINMWYLLLWLFLMTKIWTKKKERERRESWNSCRGPDLKDLKLLKIVRNGETLCSRKG